MSESPDNQGKCSWITWTIVGILFVPLVLFGPLLIVIAEYMLFGTSYVIDFLDMIGLLDFYIAIGLVKIG